MPDGAYAYMIASSLLYFLRPFFNYFIIGDAAAQRFLQYRQDLLDTRSRLYVIRSENGFMLAFFLFVIRWRAKYLHHNIMTELSSRYFSRSFIAAAERYIDAEYC